MIIDSEIAVKWCIGFEGKYSIDELGRCWVVKHHKYLKPHFNKSAKKKYQIVGIYNSEGKRVWYSISRLVAQSFLPNPNSKPFVNHLDNNPFNNTLKNLEWCTQLENEQYKYNVTKTGVNGERHGNHKLTQIQVELIRQEHRLLSYGTLAEKYNVSRSEIAHICKHYCWKSK